jgi:predicted small lipoprotein YifL
MPVRTLIIVLLAVAALSGCGRRGALEEPGARPAATAETAVQADDTSPLDPGAPAIAAPEVQPTPPPRRRFFLDFLL